MGLSIFAFLIQQLFQIQRKIKQLRRYFDEYFNEIDNENRRKKIRFGISI